MFNQLIKGCQITMHNAVLLVSQNEKLFIENQHQKQKWAQKQPYIIREGVLSDSEAQSLIKMSDNSNTVTVEETVSSIQQCTSLKYSVCLSLAHNAHTCLKC